MTKKDDRPADQTTLVDSDAGNPRMELGAGGSLDFGGTPIPAAQATPDDPFDVARLRATPLADVGVKKILLTVPARKPAKDEFFRVHPDKDYTLDCYLLEHSQEMAKDVYWVSTDVQAYVAEYLRPARIFTCVNKQGTPFLWAAKLPLATSSSGRRWSDSALQIAEHAKSHWVKMVSNLNLGAYELFQATGDLGEPAFPEKPFQDLLRLAFAGDRLIDSIEHPVLRALRGEL